MVPILNIWCRTQIRGKIREQQGIDGSCLNDLLWVFFCEFCTMVQEARVSVYSAVYSITMLLRTKCFVKYTGTSTRLFFE